MPISSGKGRSGGAVPSVESKAITMTVGDAMRDIVIVADFMQPNYKLHGLPSGFIQENIRFSKYRYGEKNTCTIGVTPPPADAIKSDKVEVFFGSENATNWRGTITIEAKEVHKEPPITLAELKAKIANDEDVRFVNTRGITDMSWLFQKKTTFNQDISRWDTSNVTTMRGMFSEARAFNQDIGNWDTSKVTNMGDMFSYANNFNQDIGNWDTSNVTHFPSMFASALKFNQDIGKWDTSTATNMYGMFNSATAFNQDIGNWDVSNATSMSHIFDTASSFDQDVSRWKINQNASVIDVFARTIIREEYKFRKAQPER